jgi:hypothetical protein
VSSDHVTSVAHSACRAVKLFIDFKVVPSPAGTIFDFRAAYHSDDLNGVVVSNADCESKGPGFESRVSHGPFQKV